VKKRSATRPEKARQVDEKAATLARLKRIEGQVRGLQKMIDDERYCADVLDQITSVEQALKGVSRVVLKNHLRHCASAALGSSDASKREAMVDELLQMIGR
jgi:DNA-binding FrmR family transcriptional regulator